MSDFKIQNKPFDKDRIDTPEAICSEYPETREEVDEILRKSIDVIYNAAGHREDPANSFKDLDSYEVTL